MEGVTFNFNGDVNPWLPFLLTDDPHIRSSQQIGDLLSGIGSQTWTLNCIGVCIRHHKFCLILDALNDAYKKYFVPQQLIPTDESQIGMKNSTQLIQYIPTNILTSGV